MASQHDSVLKTLTVALLVCLVCGVVVATAAVMLRPTQETNKLLDKQINILLAAGSYKAGMDVQKAFESIERKFVDLESGEYVEMPESYDQRKASKDPEQSIRLDGKTDIASLKRQATVAEVYLATDHNGELSKIILPVHGYGLWSTLYGFLALEPDANTVAGLGFYEHAETPGLGGEVDNPKWKAIWPGKEVFDENGDLAIQVIKGTVDAGAADASHKVDGLAGASLTTNGVNNLVRFWVGESGFGPYLDKIHANAAGYSDEERAPATDTSVPAEGEEVING
ncbi:MAG: Na(+)-translocating NADH-quinone reductase subunit C [Gammaproteobacteria bacterium]|nr:Na(+)-translocating NADH-quinone reductase subunit C [Gammaproteobacteria bacterium]MBQ0773711.1 Na(+)-translocating NADH-quinone reductase subunit C [Gammaproteobacteria bacterium]|tara:strand:+ start:3012 stop:3860 length:849 start_codon:yes stop_codon:yes gene_type:complete